MNSIIAYCCIGYCLAILVVNVYSTDYTLLSESKVLVTQPFNFVYNWNDFIIMAITLKNIPPSVTAVDLLYCYGYGLESKTVNVNEEKKTSEVKFMILKHLKHNHIVVDVQLYSQQQLCYTTNITEGRETTTMMNYYYYDQNGKQCFKYHADPKNYYKTENCLAPKPCEIIVDLLNKCQEQPSTTYFSCNIEESQLICTFTNPQNTKHRFYQTYDDDSSVLGPALEIKVSLVSKTKIFITLELFDNNTSVKLENLQGKKLLWSSEKLSFSEKDISKDGYVSKLRYSETKHVEYDCQKYKTEAKSKVHVGLINTAYKIKTLEKTSIKRKFNETANGTILCCLYYKKTNNGDLRRVVENKTILMYQPQLLTNHTESEGQTKTPQIEWLLYLVPLFLGICVLILAVYIVKKKRWCTNSHPAEETVELDNYATQNQVLYANLDFVRDENQPQRQNEEPHYANIIGVLHPLS